MRAPPGMARGSTRVVGVSSVDSLGTPAGASASASVGASSSDSESAAKRRTVRAVFRGAVEKVMRERRALGDWSAWVTLKQGIPAVDLLQHMNRVTMSRATTEFFFFFAFLVTFAFISLQARGFSADTIFKQGEAIRNNLFGWSGDLDESSSFFGDISDHDSMWGYINGPLPDALFASEWYNGDTTVEFGSLGELRLAHNFRVIGGFRIRQVRVLNDSCWGEAEQALHESGPGRWTAVDRTCYSEFSAAHEETSVLRGGYTYARTAMSKLSGAVGYSSKPDELAVSYGSGGYAVHVDFNVYSTATRLITVVRFTFEFFSSGFVLPQAAISTLSLNSWNFSFFSTWVRVGCEVGIVIFLCGYWLVQLRDLCIARKWYEPLISFHWLYDSMFFSLVILWGVLYLQLGFSPIRAQFAACTSATEKEPCMQPTEFIDLYDLAQQLEQTTLVAVCVGIAGGMKLFRLLAITPTMHLIWTTLREALSTMTVFFFAFAVINAGFSLAGLALFGHSIPGYRNWAAAFQSLMLFVLGDFDYEAMSNANPAFAATFFWAYNAINVFVMLNVLIAIVCSFFGAVITDVKATSTWRNRFSGSIFIELFTRARTLWWRLQLHCVCAICHAQERRRRRLERVEGAEVKAAPKAEAEAEASGGGGGKQQPPPAACSNTDRASHRRGTHLSNAPDQMFINLLESRNLEVDFDRQLANAMDWSLEARTSLFAFVENLYHVDVREGSNSFVSVDQICAMIGGRPVPRERLRLLQKIFWCKRAKRCGLLRSVVARCRKKRTTTSDDTGGAAGTGHGTVTAVNIQESLFDVVVDASALDIDRNGEGYHDDTAHAATLAIRRCILSITALHFELLDVKTRAPLAESSFNIKEHFFRCGYEMSFDEMWTETNSLTRGNHRRLRGGAAFVPSSVVLIRLRSKHIGGRWGHILARQRGWNAVLRLKTESPHDANRIVRVLNGNSDVRYKHMAVVSHFVSVTENDATLGQVSRTQTSHCSHKSCAARKLIESYTKIKHVFSKSEVAHSSAEVASSTPICGVPGAGAYHRSSLEQPVHSISKLDRFAVQDVGLFGRLTQQTWVINHHNFDATIFTGSSCVIHATFQLRDIAQLEKSTPNAKQLRLCLEYSTGASVITNSMHLRVRTINLSSAAERERFVVVIRALTSKLRIEAAQTYGEGWMMSSERMLRSIEGDIEVMSRAKARKMKSRGAETAARVRSGLADLIGLCENVKTKTTHDDDAFDESSSSFGAETTTEDIDDEESSG